MSKGSLISTKLRVKSIKNTSQITKAMELISSSKFKKSLAYAASLKEYFKEFDIVFSRIISSLKDYGPFIKIESDKKVKASDKNIRDKVAVIVVSSDRGLCGPYNNNVIKELKKFLEFNNKDNVLIYSVGKKVSDYVTKEGCNIISKFENFIENELITISEIISFDILSMIENKKITAAYMIYSDYEPSSGTFVVKEQILPITIKKNNMCIKNEDDKGVYMFEPKPEEMLQLLIPKYLMLRLNEIFYNAMLSEHYSRMVFMKCSYDNAIDIINKLNIKLNKERQDLITKDILEVINASEGLESNSTVSGS